MPYDEVCMRRPKRPKSPVDQIHSNKVKSRSAMLDDVQRMWPSGESREKFGPNSIYTEHKEPLLMRGAVRGQRSTGRVFYTRVGAVSVERRRARGGAVAGRVSDRDRDIECVAHNL